MATKRYFPVKVLSGENGSLTVLALMVMAILTIVGMYSVSVSNTDLRISNQVENKKKALYEAEAGVQYVLARIQHEIDENHGDDIFGQDTQEKNMFSNHSEKIQDMVSGLVDEDGFVAGYNFEVGIEPKNDTWSDKGPHAFYSIGSAGIANNPIESKIIAKFVLEGSIADFPNYAGFGDKYMEIKNSGVVYSYDEGDTPWDDDDFESKGNANIGSNELVEIKNNAVIDGDVVLGQYLDDETDTETDGEGDIHSGALIYGETDEEGDTEYDEYGEYEPRYEGRIIEPDPLGMFDDDDGNDGKSYDPTDYEENNDNEEGIDTNLTIKKDEEVRLKVEAGEAEEAEEDDEANFYFTDIDIENGGKLIIDVSENEDAKVNLFLDGGEFNAKNNSEIKVIKGESEVGSSSNFSLYSNYDSEGSSNPALQLHNSNEFMGVIYAPRANVWMNNGSNIYGGVWGGEVKIHNSGMLYYDLALKDSVTKLTKPTVNLASWKEER